MKMIIYVLSFLMAVPIIATAQEAPKKSNLIVISTPDNIDISFEKIGRILLNEGYEIETADKAFYMITTKIIQKKYGFMGGGSLEVKFTFQFDSGSDSTTINIKGRVNSAQLAFASGMRENSFDKDSYRIENIGAKGSITKSSWTFMDDIAKKYENASITYRIEEKGMK